MKLSKFSIVLGLALSLQAFAAPVVISQLDMEDGKIPADSRCSFGYQSGGNLVVSTDAAHNYQKSKGSLKGSYPVATGGMYVWGGCDITDLNTRDVYIEFYAKMPGPQKQGLKFLKIFGQSDAKGTANTTFGADYTGIASGKGSIYQVSFGDGATSVNDTQNVININGSYPEWIGRSKNTAQVYTARKDWAASKWGDGWHRFRVHVKFNSGSSPETEVPDGEYYLEIDGTVYVDAKKVFNRHYSNKPIRKVSFFDWSQGGTVPFEIWYDDITITTGGFLEKSNPKSVTPQ